MSEVANPIDLIKRVAEAALLVSPEPLSLDRLLALFVDNMPSKDDLQNALAELEQDCAVRGYELKRVASGYRFQVKQDLAPWITRLYAERPPRYTRALLETLAIIAYRQPVSRGDVEEVRGVAVSTGIMRTLLERNWIRVVGHREVPGRPALYGTTKDFLDYFNLKSLDQLPTLDEVKDLDQIGRELELSLGLTPASGMATDEGDTGIESALTQLDADAGADAGARAAIDKRAGESAGVAVPAPDQTSVSADTSDAAEASPNRPSAIVLPLVKPEHRE